MANFNFEGDLSNVRQPHLDYISNVLEKLGYKGSKVVFEAVGDAGDNYLANVKRLVINENGETFKMIVKIAPDNPILRKTAKVKKFYISEEFAYTEMIPKFLQKMIIANVPESERIKFPKCYGVTLEAPNEVIILEDLKESGYVTSSRFDSVSDENMKMILRFLAVYHSLSFVVRYQEPELFATYQKKLELVIEPPGSEEFEGLQQFFTASESRCLEILENDKHKEIVKGSVSRFLEYISNLTKFVKNSKYTVIQHGDAWIPNVMFKTENGVPTECLMLDYQMIKESSPVLDVMYIIFNSTTHKHRLKFFYSYIDFYHKELDNSLNNFGLKANLVYPRDRFDADMKNYGKFTFAANLMSADLSTKNVEEASKIKEVMEILDENDKTNVLGALMAVDYKNSSSRNAYKAKVEDLCDSYIEFGLI